MPVRDRLRQVNTLLFDLDGTLLGNDLDVFLPRYLRAVAATAAEVVDPQRFVGHLLAATEEMVVSTDHRRTNADVFAAAFYPALQLVCEEWEPVFERFYREEFGKLRSLTVVRPEARRVLDHAVAAGYQLVLATNPVFPRIALLERMRWAEVDEYPWALVTDYETMHWCKPQAGYYQEILDLVGREGSQCLMVGNDVEEDLVAGELGIVTFLETAYRIQRRPGPTGADFEGTLDDLHQLLRAAGVARSARRDGNGQPEIT